MIKKTKAKHVKQIFFLEALLGHNRISQTFIPLVGLLGRWCPPAPPGGQTAPLGESASLGRLTTLWNWCNPAQTCSGQRCIWQECKQNENVTLEDRVLVKKNTFPPASDMISFSRPSSWPESLTCRCRLSVHTPGQVFPLSWAGEQEEAATASSDDSYRSKSEMCTTSAEGPGTSSATCCCLSSAGWKTQAEMVICVCHHCCREEARWSGNGSNLWCLDVLPPAKRFCHHFPVWTWWLEQSCKSGLPNSWCLRGQNTGDCITAENSHLILKRCYLPMFPSIETLFTVRFSSVEFERRLEQATASFSDSLSGALSFVFGLIAVFPARWTLLGVILCADVLYSNSLTCMKHDRCFNLETGFNRKSRYRADILSGINRTTREF